VKHSTGLPRKDKEQCLSLEVFKNRLDMH